MHPTIRILYLLALAAAVYIATPLALVALLVALGLLMLYCRAENFLKLLRRMRWLLLFLLVIYAFNTPGEYVRQWPFEFAPTYEGLLAGLLQVLRIVIMLAGVSLLLKTTNRNDLMAGFFLLLYPLKWIRLHPERLAVRLWLTLHYVETVPPAKSISGFLDSLDKLQNDLDDGVAPAEVRLELPAMHWPDALALLLLAFLGISLL